MKRPLLPVVVLFASGILAAEILPAPLPVIFVASLGLLFAAIGWGRLRPWLLYPLLLLAGLADARLHTAVLSPDDLRNLIGSEPALVTVRGALLETPALRVYEQNESQPPAWRTQARLQISAVCPAKGAWRPASGRVAVTTPGVLTNFFSGQAVEVTGVIAQPRSAVAQGLFDYRQYLRRQGIYYQLQSESENDWRRLSPSSVPPVADRFSAWARQALSRGLPAEDQSLHLEWAVALGWKTALTEQASEPFVRAATYHIFAVDGLRMAIIFGILFGLLRSLGLPRGACGCILIPVIWFYVALTGWPASAIRATVMLTVVIAGWALKRPVNPLNSLFAAALILLIWEPQQLFQAGFQLSFFVVLCLILIIPPLFELTKRVTASDPLLPPQLRRRWPCFVRVPVRYVADLGITSLAAWIGSIPLVALYFNIVTPVSTPANILAVPLCVLVLISNLLSLLFAAWLPSLAVLFNQSGWFCMECIRVTSVWFARWPAAYFYTPAPGWFTIGVYYTVLLALVSGWAFRPGLRLWKLSGLAALLAVWAGQLCLAWPVTKITVLPVNGGSTVYCDSMGRGRDLLIDTGSTNSVQFITKPFLRAQGVNRSPPLLLSHGDLQHIGGAEPFVRDFTPAHLYTSPVRFRSAPCRRILARLSQVPGLLHPLSRNQTLAGWTVLHPNPQDRFSRADDGALVLTAALGQTRVVLLSDLGRAGQKALLERTPDLRADIVIAGLPAADEPLCEELLNALQPKLIIICDSEFPISAQAGPKLRARLNRYGVPILYTRTLGALTLEFRKNSWKLSTLDGVELSSTQLTRISQINSN